MTAPDLGPASGRRLRYPSISVQLSGEDGNGFFIAARVRAALKKGGCTDEECKEFFDEAISGDYDHLLRTCMEWVDVR